MNNLCSAVEVMRSGETAFQPVNAGAWEIQGDLYDYRLAAITTCAASNATWSPKKAGDKQKSLYPAGMPSGSAILFRFLLRL